jgi:hypothetical protein
MATVDQIAIATGMTPAQGEAALRQLAEVGLIEGERLPEVASRDRRGFIKNAALGAAIVSVTAPMAASAASTDPAGQCWWLNEEGVWVATPWEPDYQSSRAADLCSVGGGCYKWTVGQNDPYGW